MEQAREIGESIQEEIQKEIKEIKEKIKEEKKISHPNCILCRGKGFINLQNIIEFNCPVCNCYPDPIKIIVKILVNNQQLEKIREGIVSDNTAPWLKWDNKEEIFISPNKRISKKKEICDLF